MANRIITNSSRGRVLRHSIGSACVAAMAIGLVSPAAAQEVANEDTLTEADDVRLAPSGDQAIVVTATRVERLGFDAPTPTLVIGDEDFELSGEGDAGSLLREVPTFKATSLPSNQGNNASRLGSSFLNLRGLGPARTLVLLNGRRHVSTNASGWVDVNAVPTVLLDRVEVVTGGASAAWGSDAVAGVVNFILDDDIDGVIAEAQYGITQYGDNASYRAALAFGTDFAGGRGHFTIGGEISESDGITDQKDRDWGAQGWQLVSNPDRGQPGEPARLISPNVHIFPASLGGLIVGGPLFGTQFLPGGETAPFALGDLAGLFMIGGEGVNMGSYTSISVPFERQTAFAHGTYDLSDSLTLWAEGSYSRSHSVNDVVMPFNFGNLFIRTDNVFLPEDVRQQLIAFGQPGFPMGRINVDFGFYTGDNTAEMLRGAIGLDGSFGGGWDWDLYYQYGQTDGVDLLRGRIEDRFALSVDAVRDPATGQPACRVNVDGDPTNDATGCVPVNLFGLGAPSQEALNWFMGIGRVDSEVTQHVAAANVRGEPFATWAGPVSLAFGLEYRDEGIESVSDELSQANRFQIGNVQPISGGYDVWEGYAETVIPLLRESPIGYSLDLNGAIRLTDYSTSGTVTTWKVGATYSIFEDFMLRATRSRDIRAPNLNELFTGNQLAFGTITYQGNPLFVSRLVGGNLDLEPEKADTWTAGAVYTPSWLPGLRLSADYYDIDIEGSIGILGLQSTLDRCEAGNQRFCDLIIRNAAGVPTQILQPQLNLNRLVLRGIDFEARYNTPLWNGDLALQLIATHVMDKISDDGVTAIDTAGDLSPDINGIPDWRWNASATYTIDNVTLYLQGRYIGDGPYNHLFGPDDINDNSIESAFFLDGTVRFRIPDERFGRAELFLAIKNILDSDPPIVPSDFIAPPATNNAYYDTAGRTYTVGARFAF